MSLLMKITLASTLPNNESWVAHFQQIPKSSSVGSLKKKINSENYNINSVKAK